jgi:hypothetical protein
MFKSQGPDFTATAWTAETDKGRYRITKTLNRFVITFQGQDRVGIVDSLEEAGIKCMSHYAGLSA